MKIVFMGTPDFACPTLQSLINDKNFEIVAVYTRAPKMAGRGNKIVNSPIHELALKHNLKVITPKTLKTKEAQDEFINLNADAAVVVAYGLILPKEILEATKFGCINIHPSALPKYRGPAPIQYTLLNGEKETMVCIIKMDEGIDSGDILSEKKFLIAEDDTYKTLSEKLALEGAKLLTVTLKNLNEIVPVKQNHKEATFTKKITKEDERLDFSKSAKEVNNKIRALNGLSGAYFEYKNEKIKIFAAKVISEDSGKNPGEIVNEKFVIQCRHGQIQPLLLQRPGKNPVMIDDFLRGFKL